MCGPISAPSPSLLGAVAGAALALLGCANENASSLADARTPPSAEPADAAPVPGPINVWQLQLEQSGIRPWETGIAYDPVLGAIVQHGGHDFFDYVQTSYTRLLAPLSGDLRWAAPAARPQRRCIAEATYVDSIGRTITMFGGSEHGSLPQGGFNDDFTELWRRDPAGPWLYDSAADEWEDTRVRGGSALRSSHSRIAYDASSDAVFALVRDRLMYYDVHANALRSLPLPDALHRRLGYALAVDPVARRLVVFGGTGPLNYNWLDSPEDGYDHLARDDTWIFDIAARRWHRVEGQGPPSGMPMYGHVELPMVYHPPTGTMLLVQTPVSTYSPEHGGWPPAELWSFDAATEVWQRVEMADPFFAPGHLVYDPNHDLIVHVGGGRDGRRQQPSQSQHVYTARVRVDDRAPSTGPSPLSLRALRDATGVRLSWSAPDAVDVLRAPVVDGLPGAYDVVAAEVEGGRWRDVSIDTQRWAYRIRTRAAPGHSFAVFSTPPRPGVVRATVAAGGSVELRWPAVPGAVGYHVYRARGGNLGSGGERVSAAPVEDTMYVDGDAGLDDGVVRHYWVTAVDANGRQSGASPVAHTVPDAPTRVDAQLLADDRVRLQWRADRGVAVQIWHHDVHENARSSAALAAFWADWTLIRTVAAGTNDVTVELPAPREHHYFYLRALDPRGSAGFYTDIVSPTDVRFLPRVTAN